MSKKVEKQKELNFGAFVVEPMYAINTLVAYNIRSRSKNFMLRIGMGTNAFAVFKTYYGDKEMHPYLDTLINMMYQMTMIVPDEEFMNGYVKLMNEMLDRSNVYIGDISEKKALDDMRVVAAVQDIDTISGETFFDDTMDYVRRKEKELKS